MAAATAVTVEAFERPTGPNINLSLVIGKVRDLVNDVNDSLSIAVKKIDAIRALFCAKDGEQDKVERVCRMMARSKWRPGHPPNYIVVKQGPNFYLMGFFESHHLVLAGDAVYSFAWLPMSAMNESLSFHAPTVEDGRVCAIQVPSIYINRTATFEIRRSTLKDLLHRRQHIKVWGFDELPSLDETIRRERRDRILQFSRAHWVKRTHTLIANAAIMGAPLEFATRLPLFKKQKDWQKIPVIPSPDFLTEEQKAEGAKPLFYWLSGGVCLKMFGDEGSNKIL
jgi:hypothetical protein